MRTVSTSILLPEAGVVETEIMKELNFSFVCLLGRSNSLQFGRRCPKKRRTARCWLSRSKTHKKTFAHKRSASLRARNYLQSNAMQLSLPVKDFRDFNLTYFQSFATLAAEISFSQQPETNRIIRL